MCESLQRREGANLAFLSSVLYSSLVNILVLASLTFSKATKSKGFCGGKIILHSLRTTFQELDNMFVYLLILDGANPKSFNFFLKNKYEKISN
jgi:hypothetical protein